jgi:hypothetical protein
MRVILSEHQQQRIIRALDATEEQIKLMANASDWQRTWVIFNHLQAIRAALMPVTSN